MSKGLKSSFGGPNRRAFLGGASLLLPSVALAQTQGAPRRQAPAETGSPPVVFVHGTAGFRSQSLEIVTHWASRGFVVIAADHPGLYLGDLIRSVCGQDAPTADVPAEPPAALKAQIKRADLMSAYLEARQLAGFNEEECRKFFKIPPMEAMFQLAPLPAASAQAQFLDVFSLLTAET